MKKTGWAWAQVARSGVREGKSFMVLIEVGGVEVIRGLETVLGVYSEKVQKGFRKEKMSKQRGPTWEVAFL